MAGNTSNIVLLEDSDIDFEIFTMIVKTLNLKIDIVRFDRIESMAAALDENRLPDDTALILCDLRLPDGNGREIIEQVRASPVYRTTPIVVFSTSANPRDVADCYAAGANAFHCKLTDLDELTTQLSKVLDYWLYFTIIDEGLA